MGIPAGKTGKALELLKRGRTELPGEVEAG
jgi:hypothetical protein